MVNNRWKQYFAETVFFAGIFVAIFSFSTVAHPLVPYDGDDWSNLSLMRKAVPLIHTYNPIKVLPEDLFPLVGIVAANIVSPLIGDYIYAIVITSAAVFGLLICIYMYLFYRLIERCFAVSYTRSMFITTLFFLFHFTLWYSSGNSIQYLLGSPNLTCLYHYVIPAIVNLCLVLYLARHDFSGMFISEADGQTETPLGANRVQPASWSLLIFAVYLAIFSNVLLSIILTAYVLSILILRFWKAYRGHISWQTCKVFIKDNRFYFGIFLVWLISLAFEANGGRARDIGHSVASLPVAETGKIFLATVLKISKDFWAIGLLLVGASIYINYKKKSADYPVILKMYVLTSLISFLYLLLVCAKASPAYMGRSDVFISFIIWTVLLLCISLAYLLKMLPKIGAFLPILVLYFAVEACIGGSHYQERVISNGLSPQECVSVDYDIIQQVQTADRNGDTEVILHVPKGDDRDNWPHPMYMGKAFSHTLYKHGLISKPMNITIQPDTQMNEKYHIRK
ncbi:hypothetical protein [Mitsuokella multacida]|uniref:hypothetical protein n=1 Tax=Mitsuokella multacida TaxID=52226 RepID=UPI002664EA6B|nr:hypothetical protein [Mitsuokella multacida]